MLISRYRNSLLSVAMIAGALPAAAQPTLAGTSASVSADQSTPKGTLKFFTESIRAADAAKLRACLHATTPTEQRMADATANVAAALARLRLTAIEKFGEPGGVTFQSSVPTDADLKRIDSATETIDGETAVVDVAGVTATTAAGAAKMKMVKVGGVWKISVAHMVAGQNAAKLDNDLKTMDVTVRLVSQTTDEIKAGKHATDKAAYEALKSRMVAAFPQNAPPKK